MFNLVSKLSFEMFFIAIMILAAFVFTKSEVLKAEKARDLYWQLEIAKISAKAQLEQNRQKKAAQEAERRAQTEISSLEQELIKMEKANVALPVTGCGIGIERVRLLNTQASK
ncbi:hypothetical protein [Bartonella sp. CB60]|uniref:hypothetical protein n=1 Tax=Bartonella sp. CB60 TaxID=3113619 RepID=UPI00300E206D